MTKKGGYNEVLDTSLKFHYIGSLLSFVDQITSMQKLCKCLSILFDYEFVTDALNPKMEDCPQRRSRIGPFPWSASFPLTYGRSCVRRWFINVGSDLLSRSSLVRTRDCNESLTAGNEDTGGCIPGGLGGGGRRKPSWRNLAWKVKKDVYLWRLKSNLIDRTYNILYVP